MKKMCAFLLTVVLLMLSLQGCNTMKGMGEDIEEGGEAIQDAAN